MERLTTMHGGMMVPRKACTFDRDGGADDCKECTEICEDEGGVCHTCILQECLTRLGAYEDTGLTPEQIVEQTNAGWIPVEERLPEEDGTYLCTLDGELCGIEEPFTGMCGIEDGTWDEPDCVLAWRPLPDPYRPKVTKP